MADITADNVPTLNSLHHLSAVTAMIAGANLEVWARFIALSRKHFQTERDKYFYYLNVISIVIEV